MKKLKNRFLIFWNYLLKRHALSSYPVELSIGVTNHCNLRCQMCPRDEIEKNLGFMDFSLFKKIIDDAKYLELVYMHFDGESLIHPKLFEMIKYCKDKKLRVGLSSNAVLLNREKSQEIIDSGVDYLIISIDAATAETYKKIKGTDDYDVVVENVKQFLSMKGKKPYTALQLIYMEENRHEANQFKSMWKKYKPDILRIKPILTFTGNEYSRSQDISLNKQPCISLWRQLSIRWDGSMVCCLDMANKMPFGNIKNDSLKDIWNSKTLVALRELHLKGNKSHVEICKECNAPGANLLVMAGGTLLTDLALKKGLILYENLFLSLKSLKGIFLRRLK